MKKKLKPRLPRRKMPPGTRVHEDKKKEKSRTKCRGISKCDACGFGCPDESRCLDVDYRDLDEKAM